MVLPQHVLREGMWSDGEGPGLLIGILWFPFWHPFLSVLWALLIPPALVSFPANTLYVWGRGKERSVTGRLPNGAGLVHVGGWYADMDIRRPKL